MLVGSNSSGTLGRDMQDSNPAARVAPLLHSVHFWGILVRLVMHLFCGEKYKDLWFYTLFYIFILYLYSS